MAKRHAIDSHEFLAWDDSYAEQKGYRVTKKGCPLVRFSKTGCVEVFLEW